MAKMKFETYMAQNYDYVLSNNYHNGSIDLDSHSGKRAAFLDSDNSFKIVLTGQNLKYSHGELIGGTVTKIVFVDDSHNKLATIENFKHEAGALATALTGPDGADLFLQLALEHADRIIGTSQAEYLIGEGGNDRIYGRNGADFIDGNNGRDTIFGGRGSDTINGHNGRDTIYGGLGNDIIYGNSGKDKLFGGSGNDEFRFNAGSGHDVIKDFNVGNNTDFDLLHIREVGFTMEKSGGDTLIEFSDGGSVLLEGIHFSQRHDIHFDAIL